MNRLMMVAMGFHPMEEAASPTGEGQAAGVINGAAEPAAEPAAPAAEPAAGGQAAGGQAAGAINADQPQPFDFEKGTDEDYLKLVKLPDGQKWNDEAMKAYAPLLREAKISPEVFSKFVAKDIEINKAAKDKADKEYAESQKKAQEEFKAAGEAFRKEFTADQIKEMNETFSKLTGDATFATMVAKSPLANNVTMGKMLLAYRKVYGEDSAPGSGTAADSQKGFAEVWTGKPA